MSITISRVPAVPEFNIGPPMVNVTEPEGMVEVCITTSSPLARNIVVTAVTGPKSGAANQATGMIGSKYIAAIEIDHEDLVRIAANKKITL